MSARIMQANDRLSIIVAGMVAAQPGQGGAAWAVLQYVLGLRALGHEVTLVDPVTVPGGTAADAFVASPSAAYFRHLTADFGLENASALLRAGTTETVGLPHAELTKRARRADLLLSISGMLREPALTEPIPRRVFLDLDPAFNQMWHAQGIDMGLDRHTHFVTVGLEVGRPECPVPTCGREWITTLQPILIDAWPVGDTTVHAGLTTVAHWRSYGSVTHEGVFHGQKAHAWRRFIDLPRRTSESLMPALAIHPDEVADLTALRDAGWRLLDPAALCATPADYAAFLRGSKAELAIAKDGYIRSRCGWFSDRSVCYLASGRPVIATDTGFDRHLPTGSGLFSCATVDDMVAAIDALNSDEAAHRRAAREIAASCFDSRRVLPALLDRILATGQDEGSGARPRATP